jgi:hypothetical protein
MATIMAANGASLLEIGAVLGHKCTQTTARYSHLTEQTSHDLVRGTADKLLGGVSPCPIPPMTAYTTPGVATP